MGEIRLDHCCRLCLKEGFTLTNIFSHRSAAGDPLYRILSLIYDIKIDENDGFPSQICSPCMWRMIEFDACKRNVRSAEAEIMRLLNQTRPDGASEVKEVGIESGNVHSDQVSEPSQQFERGDIDELESTEMDESEARIECSSVNKDVHVKEEIDIVEWKMPVHTVIKVPKGVQHFRGANEDDFHNLESTVEPEEIPAEDFEEKYNEQVFCQPLREVPIKEETHIVEWQIPADLKQRAMDIKSSQLSKVPNSLCLEDCPDTARHVYLGGSSCITTIPENNVRIRDNNKGTSEKDLRDDVVQTQESLSVGEPKSFVDATEPGPSHLQAQQYTCGICGKNFGSRTGLYRHSNQHSNKYSCGSCGKCFGSNANLKNHSRVHTKEKPFKCEKCLKSFNFKRSLTRHMGFHSSEKPFSCKVCEIKFKRKDHRNRHELLHLMGK